MGGAVQGKPLVLSNYVGTFAGAVPHADGVGASARFSAAEGVVRVGANLYVADSMNNLIRKVVIATGEVTTVAGSVFHGFSDGVGTSARFSYPAALVAASSDILYIADRNNHAIRKLVLSTGQVTTLAGGTAGSADGTGEAAQFKYPAGITTDFTNLYVSDTDNKTVRKIVMSTGVVTTLAGAVGVSGSTDAVGTSARFCYPTGITVTSDFATLFLTDTCNSTIRKIDIKTRTVSTLAGQANAQGGTDGVGSAARFKLPYGITTDSTYLYVSDTLNNTLRKIEIATANVTTVAGEASVDGSTDGTGTAARFYRPYGITRDATNLYVADTNNQTIRKVVIATGETTTLAGRVPNSDGVGAQADYYGIQGIATNGGQLFTVDPIADTLHQVDTSSAASTTLAGKLYDRGSVDGTGSTVRFSGPSEVTTDGTSLFIADSDNYTIRRMNLATREVTTFAGSAGNQGTTDGPGTTARFNQLHGITTDGTFLYVTDGHVIRKIRISTALVTTIAGTGSVGNVNGVGLAASFSNPQGITTDGINLYISDWGNDRIRQLVIATNSVTTLAGSSSGLLDGTGTAAMFNSPFGITSDGTNLYVADGANNAIRKIVIATKQVTTIAGGNAALYGYANGTGSQARFFWPEGITTDGTYLYVSDTFYGLIRKIE